MTEYVNRRICNEINELLKASPEPFTITYSRDIQEIKIKGNITIRISKTYPFVEPQVFIFDRHYKSYRICNSERVTRLLKTMGYDCLCCSSITSHNNWSPCYHIQKILEEIKQLNVIKKNITYKIGLEEIGKKINLPEDIITELESYLLDPSVIKVLHHGT
jgi:ubiquitin-protein ligase